eukprot:CAMPEP_0172779596 /NCGR_PEP_ID=MMETSP1074-20121228/202501_1 /TAXON_ID=2916 /ORGANISM="Ceratium fusus, Strain PA161109" /LENGTH=309 /DNA_ID=CAMNT_0013616559 /DNA_START=98 /DNA_END=1026 /DNA_ORIENTATION=+
MPLLLLVTGSAHRQPLSEAERDAVGEALGQALGIMSGKVKSDSKFSICMRMFPDGPPANAAQDVTWQSCKDVLPHTGGRRAALLSGRRQPLTSSQRAQVANALSDALSVMSGKRSSAVEVRVLCLALPTWVTWQSCKDVLPHTGGRRAALISGRRQPLTSSQRDEVANALSNALSVMSGKRSSASKYESCASLFPPGDRPPANAASSGTWQACRGVLATSLAQNAVRILRQKHPLSQDEQSEVAVALTTALKAVQGKGGSKDLWSTCDAMFPDHKRPADMPDSDVTWAACRGQFGAASASFISIGKHRE